MERIGTEVVPVKFAHIEEALSKPRFQDRIQS
jgi:hypothetical protein